MPNRECDPDIVTLVTAPLSPTFNFTLPRRASPMYPYPGEANCVLDPNTPHSNVLKDQRNVTAVASAYFANVPAQLDASAASPRSGFQSGAF